MIIEYFGHSEFLLTSESGVRVLTDPYDDHVGYPMRSHAADAVTVSHGHGDHSHVKKAGASALVIDSCAPASVGADVRVTGVPVFHDDARGAKRGNNIIYAFDINGVRVAHLGDLGHALSEAQRAAIGRVDVLLVPVGGYYTIDAEQAAGIVAALSPRVVIPMHYRTSVNEGWPIAPVSEFLRVMGEPSAPRLPCLRVTAGDLSEQPALAVLDIR